jgi:hypothetical protein
MLAVLGIAAEKKKCHKYAIIELNFFCFHGHKTGHTIPLLHDHREKAVKSPFFCKSCHLV